MHNPRYTPEDDLDWTCIIYTRVLLQLVEDLDKNNTNRVTAVRWFTEEMREVALVCAICRVKPIHVYREVSRRLKQARIKSRRLTFIRWRLRAGVQLHQVRFVSLWPREEKKKLAA